MDSKDKPRWMSWAEWKAESLNRLFQRQGVLKQRARITAETVRRGENRLNGKDRQTDNLQSGNRGRDM